MGARRRLDIATETSPPQESPRNREGGSPLALAGAGGACAVPSPVHEHFVRLEASFARDATPPPFPPAVRVAIMVGAPTLLWALVILGVGAVARAVGA